MPELPEVEALRRCLKVRVRGRVIESGEVFRPRAVSPLCVPQFGRALCRTGIHPRLPAASLTPQQAARLRRAIVRVLQDAVKSAACRYQCPVGFQPAESFQPQVCGRQGLACWTCGSMIRRCFLQSRSTFYCLRCQREE